MYYKNNLGESFLFPQIQGQTLNADSKVPPEPSPRRAQFLSGASGNPNCTLHMGVLQCTTLGSHARLKAGFQAAAPLKCCGSIKVTATV